jgi:mannose-1-phosphate guanylyltransferase
MKAFLLAAGLGTRLRPITDHTPKCMVTIGGRPLLDIWLDAFDRAGVREVLINLHYLPEVVQEYLATRTSPPAVYTSYEPTLLGSAGTLVANREWVAGEDLFLVCYADNLTNFDLTSLVEFHRSGRSAATLALFRSEQPEACGIVAIDHANRVVSFVEKPRHPKSDLANAGMYVFSPSVLDEMDQAPPQDIGYDILPRLVGRARAMVISSYFRDIGSLDAYRLAQQEWRPGVLQ